MKVLLCSDMHSSKDFLFLLREKSKGVDFVICAGDFTLWGADSVKVLEEMNSWGVPVFVIHGNHEDEFETKRICGFLDNLDFIHRDVVKFKDLNIVGWGGGGFSLQDKGFERFVSSLDLDFSKVILVTHAPPFETCLDEIQSGVFVGNDSIKRFILSHNPLIAVSGHIHETFGVVCELEKTVLINPGPEGVILEL